MRREWQESLPDEVGKGSLISSYEAEKGLLWMWAELSGFLSSEDGNVAELLELLKGVKDPLEVPEFRFE